MKQSLRSNSRIARAKRTRVGRFCCRLLGDCAGGVLMEYVLLGLLVVAAVAGVVIAFGDSISIAFKAMARTARGDTGSAATTLDTDRGLNDDKITAGDAHTDRIQN